MASLPEITDVKRLAVRPGDTVVIRLDRNPSMAEADDLQSIAREALGDVPVLILGPGADIEVIEQPGDGT